jgi:hypothetical protein
VLDPASLQQAFAHWMNALTDLSQDIVALDGKTIRRSLDRADRKGPIHVVKAWASANELVVERVFSLAFALQQLRGNLGDLADRIAEHAKSASPANHSGTSRNS